MKKTPQIQKLEEMLHSSRIVAGGFFGNDPRDLMEIIDRDTAEVASKGYTLKKLADRMYEITREAEKGLSLWVDLPDGKRARIDEAKGQLICPWPDDDFRCNKRVTTLENTQNGDMILWTDLSIHLIEAHGFFEGKGSSFRIDPSHLIEMLF